MNSQDRQEVTTMIKQASNRSQFGVTPIPVHFHNGVDSPVIKTPTSTYGGIMAHNGIVVFLPPGWTGIQEVTTGSYTITHNLGPKVFYTVTANAFSSSGSGHDAIAIAPDINTVNFFIFDTTTGLGSLCDFNFTIAVVGKRDIN